MATESQLKEWKKQLIKDFPQVEGYFIDLVLDLYKSNPDYIKKLPKRKFKEIKDEVPKEIVGVVNVVPADAPEVKKWFKEPIYIPPEYEVQEQPRIVEDA